MIDPILDEYFKTGESDLLDEAFDYVRDWHRFHVIESGTARLSWQNMAAGIRAKRLAFLLDRVKTGELALRPEDADLLLALVDEHARRLQQDDYISEGNHGLFQVFGLNLLCEIAADRASCQGGRAFAARKFSDLLRGQFTEEGVHREHSPEYHFFILRVLDQLATPERFPEAQVSVLLDKARAVAPWLVFPNGEVAHIGDTGKHTQGHPLPMTPENDIRIGDFTRSGYAIARDNISMLFVTGMANSKTHKHADDLSFELFEFGRFVFVDAGKYGYNRDRKRKYVMSAAAHNTIALEGRSIKPDDLDRDASGLDAIVLRDGVVSIAGQAKRPGLFLSAPDFSVRTRPLIAYRGQGFGGRDLDLRQQPSPRTGSCAGIPRARLPCRSR